MIFDVSEVSGWVGPPVTRETIWRVQELLGVRLPQRYVDTLFIQNGGVLRNSCFPVSFSNSWASDHIGVDVLLGVGGANGIDVVSSSMIHEWGYPEIGLVIGVTPSGGHDTVMLDYSSCGSNGEPSVSYIDEDRVPRRIANSFAEFLDGLVSCQTYGGDAD